MRRILALFAALLSFPLALAGQTNVGPLSTPQMNGQLYVGSKTYPTIQSAVTAGCAMSQALVVLPPGVTVSDTPSIVSNGCTASMIEDASAGYPQYYRWNTTNSAYEPMQQPQAAPRFDVTSPVFAAGCLPEASRKVSYNGKTYTDYTCPINNAIAAVGPWQTAHPNQGSPAIYFPGQHTYVVQNQSVTSPYTAAVTVSYPVVLEGDSNTSTNILGLSPLADTFLWTPVHGSCNTPSGQCVSTMRNLRVTGIGHTQTGGGIEVVNYQNLFIYDMVLSNIGGVSLNLTGSSERNFITRTQINSSRRAVQTEGNTNENYFDNVIVAYGGADDSGYCYSETICPGGRYQASGIMYPESRSLVYLDGENISWGHSSIKGLNYLSGMRTGIVTFTATHNYLEGAPSGSQPRLNSSIQAPGKGELGHLTAAITTTQLNIPVDDAGWQPLYVQDPALATTAAGGAYTPGYTIFPADYLYGSTDASTAVSGITRGTVENVTMGAFSGDGQGHAKARGSSPIAWPAGSIIEQVTNSSYGGVVLDTNHLEGVDVDGYSQTAYTLGCNDTTMQPTASFHGNPSEMCAEIIAGVSPDGFAVPLPSTHYVTTEGELTLRDNTFFPGAGELIGQGFIKVPGNASVRITGNNANQRSSYLGAQTPLTTYGNNGINVSYTNWNGSIALGIIRDLTADATMNPSAGFFRGSVLKGNIMENETIGLFCEDQAPAGAGQPLTRICNVNGYPQLQSYNGTAWIATSGVGRTLIYNTTWNPGTLAAAAAGTVVASGPDAACTSSATGSASENVLAPGFALGDQQITNMSILKPPPGLTWSSQASNGYCGSGACDVFLVLCNTTSAPITPSAAFIIQLSQLANN